MQTLRTDVYYADISWMYMIININLHFIEFVDEITINHEYNSILLFFSMYGFFQKIYVLLCLHNILIAKICNM